MQGVDRSLEIGPKGSNASLTDLYATISNIDLRVSDASHIFQLYLWAINNPPKKKEWYIFKLLADI